MTTTAAVYPEVAEILEDHATRRIDTRVRELLKRAMFSRLEARVAIRVTVPLEDPRKAFYFDLPIARGGHPGLTNERLAAAAYDELVAWVRAGEPETWSPLLRKVYMGDVFLP